MDAPALSTVSIHRASSGSACECRIAMNHDTPVASHRDADGRECGGPFIFDTMAPLQSKRVCGWCRREETYSATEIVIIFKKGITPLQAEMFCKEARFDGMPLLQEKGKAPVLIQKKEWVAMKVALPQKKGTVIDWIETVEQAEIVIAVCPIMNASYQSMNNSGLDRKNEQTTRTDFPNEFPSSRR